MAIGRTMRSVAVAGAVAGFALLGPVVAVAQPGSGSAGGSAGPGPIGAVPVPILPQHAARAEFFGPRS
ncbi:hypothetical protein [Nocardia sp. NPDC005366]|uniref:hypothetical protein n=1 Tax=Nocardia sp. NPDC005366 TaxID=3156878 RepID=UPI0033AFCFB1